jgi:hypothetical protein
VHKRAWARSVPGKTDMGNHTTTIPYARFDLEAKPGSCRARLDDRPNRHFGEAVEETGTIQSEKSSAGWFSDICWSIGGWLIT